MRKWALKNVAKYSKAQCFPPNGSLKIARDCGKNFTATHFQAACKAVNKKDEIRLAAFA